MRPHLDHISIAVHDLARATEVFRRLELSVGPRQEFEGENTAETYVETAPVRLLLQQPRTADGPLARHLERRGSGFHHLALGVADIEAFSTGLAGSGWLMTPSSLLLRRRAGTIWLVKPEAGLLVEVFERREPVATPPGNTFRHVSIVLPDAALAARLFRGLGLSVPTEPADEPALDAATLAVKGAGAPIHIAIPRPGGDGPLHRFLRQHGPGIHHVSLPSADVHATGEPLRAETPRGSVHPTDAGRALVEIGA